MAITNLQALKSGVEYENDNLFEKVLIDHGLTGDAVYTAANESGVDLALADVYLYLASHPEIKEGKFGMAVDADMLLNLRKRLYDKWGVALPEINNTVTLPKISSGTMQTVTNSSRTYSPW